MTYTITGATGHLGTLVIQALQKLVNSHEIRAAVHSINKAKDLKDSGLEVVQMDYLNIESMAHAFKDTDILVYIPSKTYDLLQRVTEFENTLIAMKQAKISKIIFVSFFADQETNPFKMSAYYGYVPRRLAATGLEYTVLKNSLYADPLVPYLSELIERKNIIYPVGEQSLTFITQKDSAEAIANVAVNPELRDKGQSYLLSQEQAYSMPALAKIMTEVTGKPIGYQPVSLTDFATIYDSEGDGKELASMYHAGALGLLSNTTNDFKKITGHQPEDIAHFLKESQKN